MKYFIYALKSLKDSNLYIGITNDLKRRLQEHNSGNQKSTKHRKPFKLIFSKKVISRREARRLEKYYKSGYGREKLKIYT